MKNQSWQHVLYKEEEQQKTIEMRYMNNNKISKGACD